MASLTLSVIGSVQPFLPVGIAERRPTTGLRIGPHTAPKTRGLYHLSRRSEYWSIGSVADDLDVDVSPAQTSNRTGHLKDEEKEEDGPSASPECSQEGPLEAMMMERGVDEGVDDDEEDAAAAARGGGGGKEVKMNIRMNSAINAGVVLFLGTFAITKLLTVDQDYWHGWTLYEILRYAPEHNWTAYEDALETNPVLAKMVISGVVYSLGDWIAQCYEGKPLFEFDRARMFRSGLVGFSFHGSLSHYYYHICEVLFPFQDWWVVPAKVLFDQTVWSAIWNSIYFVLLGFLRRELPSNIFSELKATFWPMLTAGWKLWPFAHLITYGVIPVEQRLLWVDCVELVWVTILSTYSNEKSKAGSSETPPDMNTRPPSIGSEE
ncbi:hypothetical protein MRB53_021838 [Persea americana]|uniref:Uncharacterized protein n=1 Tax=Persea americana TaxID=3435 RepID=A0ACC2L550_PERAE|nr:hypothetical protein MRB53_021838 [Persea americana]|eukprot:TRINITY_DN2540_c0_g1_i1.p1 TRINITY_DN2540_c0_g1~~TRINITY_DN2540_c0_g1_i1.p1  ORF type:complete len:378 (-),score=59.51 TRINITY_DN2540_c0_g1_i1:488-1621(-)